jgi:hypothetical protein
MSLQYSFEIQPDPASQPGTQPIQDWVEEKIKKVMTWYDLADPTKPGQKLSCNPLIFFFFTKTTSFRFFL